MTTATATKIDLGRPKYRRAIHCLALHSLRDSRRVHLLGQTYESAYTTRFALGVMRLRDSGIAHLRTLYAHVGSAVPTPEANAGCNLSRRAHVETAASSGHVQVMGKLSAGMPRRSDSASGPPDGLGFPQLLEVAVLTLRSSHHQLFTCCPCSLASRSTSL